MSGDGVGRDDHRGWHRGRVVLPRLPLASNVLQLSARDSPREGAAGHASSVSLVLAEIREASLKLPMRHQALVLLMVVAAQYYVQISSMVLATFACRDVVEATAGLVPPTHASYWIHDMARVCWTDRQHVLIVALYGAPFALIFCFGVIALFTVQIARYHKYKQQR